MISPAPAPLDYTLALARTDRRRTLVRFLLLLAVLPVGLRVSGYPIGMYHLCAPLLVGSVIAVGSKWLHRYMGFCLVVLSVALLGSLLSPSQTLAPIASALHFLAPYSIVPALFFVGLRDQLIWSWTIRIGASAAAATATAAILSGRMVTTGPSGGLRFAVADQIPFLAGSAQVNTWGAFLLAATVAAFCGLYFSLLPSRSTRIMALVSIPLALGCVALSSSRGNSVLALVLCLVGLSTVVWTRGNERMGPYRTGIVLAVGLIGVAGTIHIASTVVAQPRIANELSRAAAPESGDGLFRGRELRNSAMLADIVSSPIIGTAFRDFAWRHPGLVDSSPHNQWLGALHKVGLPLGVLYLLGLINLTAGARPLERVGWIAFVAALGLVYDILTAAPSGIWLVLILTMGPNRKAAYENNGRRFVSKTATVPILEARQTQHRRGSP